jgi:uncharacterized protein YmfQ (DUF2313 family)
MGIAIASKTQYEDAVRRLFPQGEYWDAQLADPKSDTSLFVQAKAAELMRLRQRMSALLDESKMETTTELIADWERVYLDAVFPNLDINQRRLQLKLKDDLKLNRAELQKIAAMFGFAIKNIQMPYRPAFFGFTRFGVERAASPAAWQVIHIFVITQGNNDQIVQFEGLIRKMLFASHIPYFFYNDGGNL